MPELVSILIPAYNAERWIADTINSTLNQTWPNKEIIIVDDGSTDSTLEISKKLESKIAKVVTQQNMGACGARNKALSLAQGSYIQWLDADDLLAPDKITQQLKGSDIGRTSRILLTASFGTFYFRHQKAKFRPNSLWQDLAPAEWILTTFADNVWMNPSAWLVSRRLTELAGPWDERLSSSGDDDGEYVCRLVAASEGVRFVREAKCYYRIGNVGSLDWKMGESTKRLETLFLSLSLRINHLRSLEDSERTRRGCLRLLEAWFPLYYPEEEQLTEKFQVLARDLGGTLLPPKVSWKYYPVKNIFGWSVAKKVMSNWRKAKLLGYKNWDRLLYNIGNREDRLEG